MTVTAPAETDRGSQKRGKSQGSGGSSPLTRTSALNCRLSQGAMCGSADGGARVRLGEPGPLGREPVDVGSQCLPRTVAAGVVHPAVIEDDMDDVRPPG